MNVLHDNDPVIIFAGYPNEMKGFMNANPGLRRRVGRTFLFEDYESEHIAKIFVNKNMKQAEGTRSRTIKVREISVMKRQQLGLQSR